MDQYSDTILSLPSLEVREGATSIGEGELAVQTIHGRVTTELPHRCPRCGGAVHHHQRHKVRLRHLCVGSTLLYVEVEYMRGRCPRCGMVCRQDIPFKVEGHMMTRAYERQMLSALGAGSTVLAVSRMLRCDRNLVKDLDKRRLRELRGDGRPTHASEFIGVDEFSLHRNHSYATVVVDLRSGEVLFLEAGNGEEQMHHFIDFVGAAFMAGVKAVAMDMNAQYSAAVAKRCPHVRIVYDPFHVIKNYNERVMGELRKAQQRRLKEEIVQAKAEGRREDAAMLKGEYRLFKNSRFTLLSSRETLTAKDEAAKEHNRRLYELYEGRGLSLPPGERGHAFELHPG